MKQFRKVTAMLLCMLIAFSACLTASAANNAVLDSTSTAGSITITVYNTNKETIGTDKGYGYNNYNNTKNYAGVAGLVFELYDEAGTTSTGKTATTNSSGVATFSGLTPATYTVKVKKYPDHVKGFIENFKVTTPITNSAGNGLQYDVYAYPKLQAIYGTVTFTKKDNEGNLLSGAKFKLQKKNGNAWTDYPNNTNNIYTTGNDGRFTISDLPYGDYQLIETVAPKGFNLDTTPINFSVKRGATSSGNVTYTGKDGTDNIIGITFTNYKSSGITKRIDANSNVNLMALGDGSYTMKLVGTKGADTEAENTGNNVTWIITTTIPADYTTGYTEFKIVDSFPNAYKYVSSSITVGTNNPQTFEEKCSTDGTNKRIFNFKSYNDLNAALAAHKGETLTIHITAQVTDPDVMQNDEASRNKVDLYYTKSGTADSAAEATDYSEPLSTCGVKFKKVDESNEALGGAEFKLYATEKDAKEGKNALSFYTGYAAYTGFNSGGGTRFKKLSGWSDVATSDKDGYFGFYGLAAGTYYMVETKAPNDYELLKEVKVINLTNGSSIDGSTYDFKIRESITNIKKAINLPFTGGVGAEVVVASGVLMMVAAGFVLKKRVK